MKVIDLTHTISPDLSVYTGTKPPRFETCTAISLDGIRKARLTLFSHTGTHIDSPAHLLERGRTVEDYPPDRFVGRGKVLDLTQLQGETIFIEYG